MFLYNKEIFNNVFSYPARYWYKNLKHIPLYFRRIYFLIKNGYDQSARWDTFIWFIRVIEPILKKYKTDKEGIPAIPLEDRDSFSLDEASWDEREVAFNNAIDKMLENLDLMKEDNPIYAYEGPFSIKKEREKEIKMNEAKEEFFKLFSQYFYYLWD